MSMNTALSGLPALFCAGLIVWSVSAHAKEELQPCKAGMGTIACQSCITTMQKRFGNRLVAHLCGIPPGVTLPASDKDDKDGTGEGEAVVIVDPVAPSPKPKPSLPAEEAAAPVVEPLIRDIEPASFRTDDDTFVSSVARVGAASCDDFRQSMTATFTSSGALPEFRRVHDTCQAMNIYDKGIERDAQGRVVFTLDDTLTDLSRKIDGFLDQDTALSHCERKLPAPEFIDELAAEVESVQAAAKIFLSCEQWYETLGRCFLDADAVVEVERALAGYREWLNDWEDTGSHIEGDLKALIEGANILSAQKKVIGC